MAVAYHDMCVVKCVLLIVNMNESILSCYAYVFKCTSCGPIRILYHFLNLLLKFTRYQSAENHQVFLCSFEYGGRDKVKLHALQLTFAEADI